MSEEKQLPAISITPEMAPAIFIAGGLDQFLSQIREAVSEVPDLSTKKGRDRVASLAASVSRSKTAVEKPGRDYLRKLKEAVKPAEQEIKRFVDECDQIRDTVRLPLTEFENAEKQRVADLKDRLEALRWLGEVLDDFGKLLATEHIINRLDSVKRTEINDSWQELTAEAGVAKDAVIFKLEAALVEAQKRDAEAAELERLRAEQALSAQHEREAAMLREAEERVRRETEEKNRAELEAAAKREADAKAAAERADRELIEAGQRAEREKQAAVDAERLRAQQAEQDRLAEEKRIADEAAKKAANVEHRREVNRGVVADLIAEGVPEDCAKKCVEAVARMKVRNMHINY
ncbi:hypothetical protein ABQ397_13255 [Serratia fonticola]|uniref:hypothetical protein n=1 Tax=Serratia fonticola TaxID=47917 RepID=UPI003AAA81E4